MKTSTALVLAAATACAAAAGAWRFAHIVPSPPVPPASLSAPMPPVDPEAFKKLSGQVSGIDGRVRTLEEASMKAAALAAEAAKAPPLPPPPSQEAPPAPPPARSLGPVPKDIAEPLPSPPPSSPSLRALVHVASFRTEEQARRASVSMFPKGFPPASAIVAEAELPKGMASAPGRWFRVAFSADPASAEAFCARLRRSGEWCMGLDPARLGEPSPFVRPGARAFSSIRAPSSPSPISSPGAAPSAAHPAPVPAHEAPKAEAVPSAAHPARE